MFTASGMSFAWQRPASSPHHQGFAFEVDSTATAGHTLALLLSTVPYLYWDIAGTVGDNRPVKTFHTRW